MGDEGFHGWATVVVLALLTALAVGSATTGLFFWLNEQDALYLDNPGVLWPGRLLAFLSQADRLGMLLLPLGGWIVDRYGPRRVLLIAIPLFGFGGILVGAGPFAAALAGLLTVGAIRGVGVRLPTATVVNHWFRRRRAIAIAVLQFAASVAGLTVSLVRDSVGRPPVIVLGGLLLVIGFLIARAIRNRPEDSGQGEDFLAVRPGGSRFGCCALDRDHVVARIAGRPERGGHSGGPGG
jgi:MFS family permease